MKNQPSNQNSSSGDQQHRNHLRLLSILGAIGVLTVLSFQNCAGGFSSPGSGSESSSSTDGGPAINNTGALGAQFYLASGTTQISSTSLKAGTTYMMHASGAGIDTADVLWAVGATNSAACTLLGTGNQLVQSITCTTSGTTEVDITAYWANGSSSTAAVTVTVGTAPTSTATPAPAADPNINDFHIAVGTNAGWNTASTPVVAYVGQTLRIHNDDTKAHRLHTDGTPCAHQPNDSAQGTYYDCVLATTHSATATDLYDHDVGSNTVFYLSVLDGTALYATGSAGNCAACHGALATSQVKGASFTAIKSAISSQSAMRNLVLTDDQIHAIAYNLNK